jgi:hypothetical protein
LTGQIVDTISLDKNKTVLEVLACFENNSIIISKDNDNMYYLSGHTFKDTKFRQDFLISIGKCIYCKIMKENDKLLLIIQLLDNSQIKLGRFSYESISNETKLENLLSECSFKASSILYTYLTDKHNLLVFHLKDKLIASKFNEILSETDLESKVSTRMYSIKDHNGLVGLNETNNLVIYLLNEETRKFTVKVNENQLDSLILLNEFLILHNGSKLKISRFSSETLNSFEENILFETKLNSHRAYGQFGLSPNYKYLYFTENKRILKFISLVPNVKNPIIEIPMYNQVRSIVCSNEYISMILQNRRVVSFLINDLNQKEKIKTMRYIF